MTENRKAIQRYQVLGVPVDAIQIPGAIDVVKDWIAIRGTCRFVAVTGMHGVMEAQQDQEFHEVLKGADLVVPDGMPLVWLGRRRGHRLKRRVYGPELMQVFCAETGSRFRHYFYGGAPGVAQLLAERLKASYGIEIAGVHCPPFRETTTEENRKIIEAINASNADVLWVGLSTPKQERWAFQNKAKLNVPAVLCVGAAFDFGAGVKAQAPKWIRESGLEWLYRLLSEPRRLWRRYLVNGSRFVWAVLKEEVRVNR